jgi:hypothetical protein
VTQSISLTLFHDHSRQASPKAVAPARPPPSHDPFAGLEQVTVTPIQRPFGGDLLSSLGASTSPMPEFTFNGRSVGRHGRENGLCCGAS